MSYLSLLTRCDVLDSYDIRLTAYYFLVTTHGLRLFTNNSLLGRAAYYLPLTPRFGEVFWEVVRGDNVDN